MERLSSYYVKAENYRLALEDGTIEGNRLKVLDLIKGYPYLTNPDIIDVLKMPHQSVTSATSLLQDLGLIKVVSDVKKGNRMYSVFGYVKDLAETKVLINKRYDHKKMLLIKKCSDFGLKVIE